MEIEMAQNLSVGTRLIIRERDNFDVCYFIQLVTDPNRMSGNVVIPGSNRVLVRVSYSPPTVGSGMGTILIDLSKLALYNEGLWNLCSESMRLSMSAKIAFDNARQDKRISNLTEKQPEPEKRNPFIKRKPEDFSIVLTANAPRYDLFLKKPRPEPRKEEKPSGAGQPESKGIVFQAKDAKLTVESVGVTREISAGSGLTGAAAAQLEEQVLARAKEIADYQRQAAVYRRTTADYQQGRRPKPGDPGFDPYDDYGYKGRF